LSPVPSSRRPSTAAPPTAPGVHDFYDQPEYVTPALAKIETFFKEHL
jgi:hypothetical protein